jgi:uncharacterized protein (TIGR03086 family)
MTTELLDLYRQASRWTLDKVAGAATSLDADTPCDDWDVRTLLSHMLETQDYFVGAAKGEDVSPPSGQPSHELAGDPVAAFERARTETIDTFGQEAVIEKTGPSLGIAFSDQLLHGWDLARATGQEYSCDDTTAQVLLGFVEQFDPAGTPGLYGPALPIGDDAPAFDRVLARTGRDPRWSAA